MMTDWNFEVELFRRPVRGLMGSPHGGEDGDDSEM